MAVSEGEVTGGQVVCVRSGRRTQIGEQPSRRHLSLLTSLLSECLAGALVRPVGPSWSTLRHAMLCCFHCKPPGLLGVWLMRAIPAVKQPLYSSGTLRAEIWNKRRWQLGVWHLAQVGSAPRAHAVCSLQTHLGTVGTTRQRSGHAGLMLVLLNAILADSDKRVVSFFCVTIITSMVCQGWFLV